LDNYFPLRLKTLKIMARAQTIEAIKRHYLNDLIWPDFSKIKLNNSTEYALEYVEINCGKKYHVEHNSTIQAFKTDHTVDSCGYIYKKNDRGIIITADTYSLETMIEHIDTDKEIKAMVVECSFPSEMENLAKASKHLTPKLLFNMLQKLQRDDIELYINHIKPIHLTKITSEIEEYRGKWKPKILKDGENINF